MLETNINEISACGESKGSSTHSQQSELQHQTGKPLPLQPTHSYPPCSLSQELEGEQAPTPPGAGFPLWACKGCMSVADEFIVTKEDLKRYTFTDIL